VLLNSTENINAAFNRILSMSLRHKVPLKYVVKNLKKITQIGLTSYVNTISRILTEYLDNESLLEVKSYKVDFCPNENNSECELETVEGCVVCKKCGYSGCN
jgi:hypothetical protein